MQYSSHASRFSPASVGALIEPTFLRSVLRDMEAPTHPDAAWADAALAQAAPLHGGPAQLLAAAVLALQQLAHGQWPGAGS